MATNSAFRGFLAFVSAETAVPLQVCDCSFSASCTNRADPLQLSIGDGGLYSIWAGLIVFAEGLILLVWWKGKEWRERSEEREARGQNPLDSLPRTH